MKKLAFQNQCEIFERIVRDKRGRLYRFQFIVVRRDGALRGKVISVTPITALQKRFKIYDLRFKKRANYLPIRHILQGVKNKGLRIKNSYVSPYFNKFEFLTVIKIRAPARSV